MKNQPKLICFDVDDTLTEGSAWFRLTTAVGWSWDEHKKVYQERLAGLRTFKDNHAYVLASYRETGNANQEIMNAAVSQTELRPGAKELFELLRQNGFKTYLLSGGFKNHVSLVAELLGADGYSAATDLVFDEKGELKDMIIVESQKDWKVEEIQKISVQYGVPMEEMYLIGDGENDVEIFKRSKRGIAVHTTDPELLKYAWKEVQSLQEIPKLLGIE